MEDCQVNGQAYFLNIDFDYELFARDYFLPGHVAANKEWDYILLWLLSAKDKAILHTQYDESYLSSIEKVRGFRPSFVGPHHYQADQVVPYWGNWGQYQLKRVYANKASLIKHLPPHSLVPSFQILYRQLSATLPSELPLGFAQWALRPGKSFGGKGIQIFPVEQWKTVKDKLSTSREDWVLMPWLKRILDVGTIFDGGQSVMSYLNLVDKRGSYRGSYHRKSDKDKLNKLTLYLEKLLPQELKLIKGNYASDSFFFKDERDEAKLDFYPFIEFNMRRTMGSMLYLAPSLFVRKSWVGWFLIPAKGISSFPTTIEGNGWSIHTTSPSGKKFWTFYLAFDEENDLRPMQDLNTSPDKHLVLLRDHLSSLFAPEHNLRHFQIPKW